QTQRISVVSLHCPTQRVGRGRPVKGYCGKSGSSRRQFHSSRPPKNETLVPLSTGDMPAASSVVGQCALGNRPLPHAPPAPTLEGRRRRHMSQPPVRI